jgi:hypothetical protein
MTTEVLTSTPISNRDATPKVPNSSFLDNGIVRASRGSTTVTSGATTGSVYPLVSVPSNCRVITVKLNNPAGSASSAFDIGVYKNASSGASSTGVTAADADFFATAVACTSANVDLDVTGESTTYTNAKREQPLWQALGLASDPGGTLDISLTNTATNAAAFSVGLEVLWTI